MANTPKKVKDPTEVALSAIQEALNISDTAADTSRSASMRNETASSVAPPMPPMYDEPAFEPRPAANERAVFDRIEEPRSSRRAANDDRETIGQLLQSLQTRPPCSAASTPVRPSSPWSGLRPAPR